MIREQLPMLLGMGGGALAVLASFVHKGADHWVLLLGGLLLGGANAAGYFGETLPFAMLVPFITLGLFVKQAFTTEAGGGMTAFYLALAAIGAFPFFSSVIMSSGAAAPVHQESHP